MLQNVVSWMDHIETYSPNKEAFFKTWTQPEPAYETGIEIWVKLHIFRSFVVTSG